jgi:hypothetical protein
MTSPQYIVKPQRNTEVFLCATLMFSVYLCVTFSFFRLAAKDAKKAKAQKTPIIS